jgi:hypothetical protein
MVSSSGSTSATLAAYGCPESELLRAHGHWDEGIAKLAGLPDVIAHGMLTMGLGAGFASAWSGDPGAVTRYAVRLSAPAIVSATEGADIEFSGRIKSLDPETPRVSSLSPRSPLAGRSSA